MAGITQIGFKDVSMMRQRIRWKLFLFDLLFYLFAAVFILVIYPSSVDKLTAAEQVIYIVFGAVCVFVLRFAFLIYNRIWRYAVHLDYLRMVVADLTGGLAFVLLRGLIPIRRITFVRAVSIIFLNLLGAICMRLVYQFAYQNRNQESKAQRLVLRALQAVTGVEFAAD